MPQGNGYWIYTGAGRVFSCSYGKVDNEDDLIAMGEQGVVDMAAHPGGGYWLLEADGDVHAFGGAPHHGSAQLEVGNGRAVSLVPVADGSGYRVLTMDRDLINFGSASPLSSSDRAVMLSPDVVVINDMAALPGGGDGAEPQLGCRHPSRQRPHPGVAAERDVAQNGNIRPGADTHRKARLPIRMVFENCVS